MLSIFLQHVHGITRQSYLNGKVIASIAGSTLHINLSLYVYFVLISLWNRDMKYNYSAH